MVEKIRHRSFFVERTFTSTDIVKVNLYVHLKDNIVILGSFRDLTIYVIPFFYLSDFDLKLATKLFKSS